MDLKWKLQPEREKSVKLEALKIIKNSLNRGRGWPVFSPLWQKRTQAIQEVIDSGCAPLLRQLVFYEDRDIMTKILDILMLFTTGTLKQLHTVVDEEFLDQIARLSHAFGRYQGSGNYEAPELLGIICKTCVREGDWETVNSILKYVDLIFEIDRGNALKVMADIGDDFSEQVRVDQELMSRIFQHIIEPDAKTFFETLYITESMKYLTYDSETAQFIFRRKLLSRLFERYLGRRRLLVILNWLARSYPEEVFEACAPAPTGNDLYAKVMNLYNWRRFSANDRIVDLLTEFVQQGYTQGVITAGWLPYLVSVAPRPRVFRRWCQLSPVYNKVLRKHTDFRVYHLIAKIVLDTLETNPIRELVTQGAIEPLCRYLQHEPHAHVALYDRPWEKKSPVDFRKIQRLEENHVVISSPLLALVGIMMFGEVEKNRRRLPANPYAQTIKEAGGLKGSRYFRSSYNVNNRAHARVLITLFSIT